ncbi:MAG: hypothetical protein KatS3mg075_132 [Meiothermus sp.]|jgi:tetratricopeptide (TPR) repeat protein|uniref:Tetratricopeptide repeat protein n=1 Tax=Meiothermus ruber TaxID=277 RepID=A0A7C3HEF3_MEIRU|nr:MAG: hypothetical protein KatS3mg075_132 [Meiothermus sp.]
MPATGIDRAQLLSTLCEFASELAYDCRYEEAAEMLEGATRWFAPPDVIDEEIALAKAWVQLGVLQAELGAYDDALRSFRRVYAQYWGEKEDQELLDVSARAWLEKSLVLLRRGNITEAAEALLGTVSGSHWDDDEQLMYLVSILERASAICGMLDPSEGAAFFTLLASGLVEVENEAVRSMLETNVQRHLSKGIAR